LKKALIAVILLAACDGYRLVGLEPLPIALNVTAVVLHDDRLGASLAAFFSPGRDESGRENAFADSTLVVGGEALMPTVAGDASRFYELVWEPRQDPTGIPDSISVIGPRLAAGAPWTWAIMAHLPRRQGAFRRDHAFGATISLELPELRQVDNAATEFVTWRLEVLKGGEPSAAEVSIQGRSASSSAIDIPWSWLSEEVAVGDSLTVRYSRFIGYEVTDAPYPTRLSEVAVLHWRLVIVSPP
jgi:hypothetical protein